MQPPLDPGQQFSEQIARLQKRQLELVQQSSKELEDFKREFEEQESYEERFSKESQPLVQEIANLRSAVEILQSQRANQEATIETLNEVLGFVRHGMGNSLKALKSLDGVLSPSSEIEVAAPLTAIELQKPMKAELKAEKKRKEKELKAVKSHHERKPLHILSILPSKKLVRRVAVLGVISVGVYAGFKQFSLGPQQGEVAGASIDLVAPTSTPETSVTNEYKESFADVPFEKTTWEKSVDSELGISVEYPSNTSNRIHTVGSSNVWFLRKNGYLMKISSVETEDTIDNYVAKEEALDSSLTYTKASFKGINGYLAKANGAIPAAGYQYFIKKGSLIYIIWIKEEPPTTDDGQRVARMVSSLQFTN